jgi:protein-S-isoprenylcysteine O-methyltransferase Ste14
MPTAIRFTLIALGIAFLLPAAFYRIRSQQSGEPLDRTREGWTLLVGIRLSGFLTMALSVAWLWVPALFTWASLAVPIGVRWVGVGAFAFGVAWLLWMFHTLGLNLTDTVVVRRDAYFVSSGPYRYVRNPMYTGILVVGIALGIAMGTWLLPLFATLTFMLLALRTRTEEQFLLDRFGGQYRAYMQRVGRFFPKFRATA